jgi:hypothetical protein
MSGRGIDFLENWLQRNVTEADKKGSRDRAKELADKCIAEAAAPGITIDDMEPEWGSVETIIYEAMQNGINAEVEFWKKVAAMRDRRERNCSLTHCWQGQLISSFSLFSVHQKYRESNNHTAKSKEQNIAVIVIGDARSRFDDVRAMISSGAKIHVFVSFL